MPMNNYNYDAISLVSDYLSKVYDADISTTYYSYIREWRDWYRGYYKPFHSYTELGVTGAPIQRKLYTMKMAQKICQDWASILLNEKTTINIEDEASSEFVQGNKELQGLGGVLGENHFFVEANELCERAFALGTGAFALRVANARIGSNGKITPDAKTKVQIDYVDASCIIPLSIEKSQITEVAFVSERVKRGKNYIYLEIHTKDDNGNYVIHNKYFGIDSGAIRPEKLPCGMAEVINTDSSIPWFSFIYPNITNNIAERNGLGVSVYGGAIDNLISTDLAFNNFVRDLKLGGKKVFVNKSMTKMAADGSIITPDDVAQSLFSIVGDETNFDAAQMMQEYNPSLRSAENKECVQEMLNYLSFKCGLGNHRYKFDQSNAQTATQYVGEKQDLIQSASRHMIVIEQSLIDLVKAILYIGKTFCEANVDPETNITINFEDGFVISNEDKQAKDLALVQQGIMQPWEYRVRWMNETPEEAKAILSEMKTATSNPFNFGM